MRPSRTITALIVGLYLLSCAPEHASREQRTLEHGVRDLLRHHALPVDITETSVHFAPDGSVQFSFVASRNEVDRIIEAFGLRPWDEPSAACLPGPERSDPAYWRRDAPFPDEAMTKMELKSISLAHGASEAWAELVFTSRVVSKSRR
jgi:hypothetical protein